MFQGRFVATIKAYNVIIDKNSTLLILSKLIMLSIRLRCVTPPDIRVYCIGQYIASISLDAVPVNTE